MAKVFEIKATLKGITPDIYRVLKVNSKMSLQILHEVFQAAFSWENYHLHFYQDSNGKDIKKELLILLDEVLAKNQNITYVYDYGDSWTIEISLLNIFEDKNLDNYPICIGGARHAPPEDSGGVTGYELALELIRTKEKRNYTLITEWYGNTYDPEQFSVDEVNSKLTHLKGI